MKISFSLFFFLFCFLSITDTLDPQKMVIIYGEPFSYSNSQLLSINDWNACVGYCYTETRCVAVHKDDLVPGCKVFNIGEIMEIKKLGPYSGRLMAVKMISNSTCSPNSSGNSMFNRIQTNSTYQNYTITEIDDIWQFTTSPFFSCPDTFRLVFRPLGLWCMGIVLKTSASGISQVEAVEKCAADYNGILSGFETTEEKLWVVDITKGYLASSSYPTHGYWVNGARKASCMYQNQIGAVCAGSKAFTFTDPTMSMTNAYVWGLDSQPDGMTNNLGTSNCIAYRIKDNNGYGMDDRPCNTVANPGTVFYNGFLCGLRPNET